RLVVERVNLFACESGISQAPVGDFGHEESETVRVIQRIVFGSAVVESEYLFVKIAVKMERLNRHVSPAQGALHQRPEVVYALSVYLTANVLTRMIHYFMDELRFACCEAVVCGVVSVQLGAGSNCIQDCGL